MKNDLNKSVGYSSTFFNLRKRNDELRSKYGFLFLFFLFFLFFLIISRASELYESNKKIEADIAKFIKDNEKYRPKKDLFNGKYPYLTADEFEKKPEIDIANIIAEELIPGKTLKIKSKSIYL